jgi:hypothetical protein
VEWPKGRAGQKCACCAKPTCSHATTDSVTQEVLQAWLDSQPLPDTLNTLGPTNSTPQRSIASSSNLASEAQGNMSIMPSTETPHLLDTSSTPTASTSRTLREPLNRSTTPPLPSIPEPFPVSRSPDRDVSQSADAKRPRDTGSTQNTEKPDKAAKTARTHCNTPLPPTPPSHPNDVEATKEIGRLEEIIRDKEVEYERLNKNFNGYRMMSGSIAAKAAEHEIEHKLQMEIIKRQLDDIQARSKETADKTEESSQAEMGRMGCSDQAKEAGWESQMRKLDSQYNAAVTNADTSRKARNEALAILATTQAEKALLQEQLAIITANHEHDAIELSDSRAENERLRAEVADFAKVKASLQTTEASHDQHLADKTRLSIELEDAKDMIGQLKSKIRVHTDMARIKQEGT